ncbi:MAG: hypothetical protein AB1646_11940 [Thermodesulfobacteriota bacterium]
MQAEYLPDGTIAVSGSTRKEKFTRMWAGIGWPDRIDGHLCAVGERQDGRFHALWEQQGGLWRLGDAAVEARRLLLVDRILVDATDTLATSYLRTLEGLCFDDNAEAQDAPLPVSAGEQRTLVTVTPVPKRILSNFRSALEQIKGIITDGRLMIHSGNCPRLVYTIRQPLQELNASPVMRSLVWVITALEEARHQNGAPPALTEPWYSNPPKP